MSNNNENQNQGNNDPSVEKSKIQEKVNAVTYTKKTGEDGTTETEERKDVVTNQQQQQG